MTWKPLNDKGMLMTEPGAIEFADWLARSGGDSFGLPLVGSFLGLQSLHETTYDLLAAHEWGPSEGSTAH